MFEYFAGTYKAWFRPLNEFKVKCKFQNGPQLKESDETSYEQVCFCSVCIKFLIAVKATDHINATGLWKTSEQRAGDELWREYLFKVFRKAGTCAVCVGLEVGCLKSRSVSLVLMVIIGYIILPFMGACTLRFTLQG